MPPLFLFHPSEYPMNTDNETANDIRTPDELQMLKDRARLMGITHSNNIGLEALRAKINAKMTETNEPLNQGSSEDAANPLNVMGDQSDTVPERPMSLREKMLKEQMKLVRLRITNLDPKKASLPGEIYTVANEYLGTVRKYIPFGEATQDGYHVPYCLYTFLKDKKFLSIRTTKSASGQPVIKHSMAQEFGLEILPPLTQAELDKLGAAQTAAGVFNNDELF